MINENTTILLNVFRELTPKSQIYILNMATMAKVSEDAIKEELKIKKERRKNFNEEQEKRDICADLQQGSS